MSDFVNKIDGTATAKALRGELKVKVEAMKEKNGVTPGLAVILVGERRDSQSYVRSKKKACAEVGIESFGFDYSADIEQEVIIEKVRELNADPKVHGKSSNFQVNGEEPM